MGPGARRRGGRGGERGLGARARAAEAAGAAAGAAAVREVVRLVGGTARGTATDPAQRRAILAALEAAEAANPTPNGAESELLPGWWALLYQAPEREEDVGRAATTTEGPVLGALRPVFRRFARSRRQRQRLDPAAGAVSNRADFALFPGGDREVAGFLDLRGTCARSSPTRLDVELTEAVLGIGRWEGALSLGWVRPRGWVEVTYLDDTYRIGRGDKGSVFVAVREGKSGPAAAAEEG